MRRKGARPELSEDQKQEIREAFELFDSEKTGFLDYHELKVGPCHTTRVGADCALGDVPTVLSRYAAAASCCKRSPDMDKTRVPLQVAMRALGFPVKKEEVRKILSDYDREGAGKIAFDDFVEVSELPCWSIPVLPEGRLGHPATIHAWP
jgi:centrin-3